MMKAGPHGGTRQMIEQLDRTESTLTPVTADRFPEVWRDASSTDSKQRLITKLSIPQVAAQLVPWISKLVVPDQVLELRVLHVIRKYGRSHAESGFYDSNSLLKMMIDALTISPMSRGVYFTLNPLKPVLLSRRTCRLSYAGSGESATDQDVINRNWLFIDADPIRDPHVSATDDEKAYAEETIYAVREFLSQEGWPKPLVSDSGNGFHLLYRIDLPTNDRQDIPYLLKVLADQFDSDHVKIDQSVGNLARICKLPGTWARKGDPSPERPHRVARIVEVP
jgi:hypothetical protein